jgi:redox-sensitive bicupin YhaK (pirin superfamily)
MTPKSIKAIIKADRHVAGEHPMRQPLPAGTLDYLDPFILLHHHGPYHFGPNNAGLPFGPHPHRGFETVTLIYQGDVQHQDSRGHNSIIGAGGVQWMTAARGIVHSENTSKAFRENGGDFELIQLWINLPAALKMSQPVYQGLQKDELPVTTEDDGRVSVQVIAGQWNDTDGPVNSVTGIDLFNLDLQPGATVNTSIVPERNVLLYVLRGPVTVNGRLVNAGELVHFGNDEAGITITSEKAAKVLLGSGEQISEPIATHGPFVMNNTTEIMEAFRDYQMGKMGILIEE